MGTWSEATGSGYLLGIDPAGCLAVRIGNGDGKSDGGGGMVELSTGRPLLERHWYLATASFDAATGEVWVAQYPLHRYHSQAGTAAEARVVSLGQGPQPARGFRIAAAYGDPIATPEAALWGHHRPALLYNGKIDGPAVLARPATPLEQQEAIASGRRPGGDAGDDPDLVAAWDFSQEIPTTRIVDRSRHGLHGEAINLPTRAMTGWNWDGTEYNWQHRPEHYGAIHFHDDDLYDCRWETDFVYQVPGDLPSGLYGARLSLDQGDPADDDWIPFVVSPPVGRADAPLALILPSASYWAYANTHHVLERREGELIRSNFTTVDATTLFLHEHPEYGCSMYDRHSDGSGVCISSRLRPVLTIRPRERLWQLPARHAHHRLARRPMASPTT